MGAKRAIWVKDETFALFERRKGSKTGDILVRELLQQASVNVDRAST